MCSPVSDNDDLVLRVFPHMSDIAYLCTAVNPIVIEMYYVYLGECPSLSDNDDVYLRVYCPLIYNDDAYLSGPPNSNYIDDFHVP